MQILHYMFVFSWTKLNFCAIIGIYWNLKLMDSGLIVYQNGLLHNSSEFLEQMFQDGWAA